MKIIKLAAASGEKSKAGISGVSVMKHQRKHHQRNRHQ